MFNKIAIIGVGLIGGSIGLAARKKKLAKEIVGVCRRESSREKALKFSAVDRATLNLKKGLEDADLIIIATQVGKIVSLAKKSIQFMKKGAILTDVGSSKKSIVAQIEKAAKRKVNFIGSHPMAGSDKSGVENADSDIFKGATILITTTKNTDKGSLAILTRFWRDLGCRVIKLSPEKHDKLVSLASYLPHVVAFLLSSSQTKNSVKIAAGSLCDTTRVASSDTELWKEIFLASRLDTLNAIRIFSNNLKVFEKSLKKKDPKAIKRFLDRAKKIRCEITQ